MSAIERLAKIEILLEGVCNRLDDVNLKIESFDLRIRKLENSKLAALSTLTGIGLMYGVITGNLGKFISKLLE